MNNFERYAGLVLGGCLLLPGIAFAHGNSEAMEPTAGMPAGVDYAAKSTGTRTLVQGPVSIKMLVDASNIGRDDIEIGELYLPAGFSGSGDHVHGSLEMFYVVEGVLGHEVNGVDHRLEPGDVGIVKPGDTVNHTVMSDGPMRAVVVWVPGGEAGRLIEYGGFTAMEP